MSHHVAGRQLGDHLPDLRNVWSARRVPRARARPPARRAVEVPSVAVAVDPLDGSALKPAMGRSPRRSRVDRRPEHLRRLGLRGEGRIDLALERAADRGPCQPFEVVGVAFRKAPDRPSRIASEVEDRARARRRSTRLRWRPVVTCRRRRPRPPGACNRASPLEIIGVPQLRATENLPRGVQRSHHPPVTPGVGVMLPRERPVRGQDHLGIGPRGHLEHFVEVDGWHDRP